MHLLKHVWIILVLFTLAGCGKTVVGSSGLVPESLIENTKAVEASQGFVEVTSSLPSQLFVVDPDEYQQGLENAFSAAGLFAGGEKKYDIQAEILKLEYPSFGATMDAKYVVKYTVVDNTGRNVGERTVTSEGSCPMSEHFIGSVRVHRAIERSIEQQYPLAVECIVQVISADLAKGH